MITLRNRKLGDYLKLYNVTCEYWNRTENSLLRSWKRNGSRPSNILTRSPVTTWTPLASTFNTRQGTKLNLSLTRENTGLFGWTELRDPTGFNLLEENALNAADFLVEESCSSNRKRPMVAIFDELSDTLCRVADLSEFIRVAHPVGKFASAAEYACISINALVERLNTNRNLYLALKKVVDDGDIFKTDEVDQHVAKLFLFDFEQCGIHLEDDKRARVVQLNDRILYIGSAFMQGTVKPRMVPREDLPQHVQDLFSTDGENVIINGLYADCANDVTREAAYKIFLYPDAEQETLLKDLLNARYELASLCGFPTFAHRALRGSLAGNPEMVWEFLETLSQQLHLRAKKDFEEMKEIKREKSQFIVDVKPWDTPYITAIAKNERFKIDVQEVSQYFSLGACMEGLNLLFNSLFDVTLELQETEHGEVWAPDVHKLSVVHRQEGTLGYIYCDFFERAGKPNQDCHFTIRGGRELQDGSYQLPVVVLLLNFPPPTWTTPSLLTPGMVDNLFHEMGHAMHSMMARTKYQHVTGTRCSTDFAEVPSILMEYFSSDPRVLSKFARHYKTGKSLNFDDLSRLCRSKYLFNASDVQLQVFYAIIDQQYHGEALPPGSSTTDILTNVQNQYFGLPYVQNTAWQHRFGHLVSYGAKYYSYLMSRAVASWIWQEVFQNDPFNRKMGERYRAELLSHGGGKPAEGLIQNFLNKNVTPTALADILVNEIDSRENIY